MQDYFCHCVSEYLRQTLWATLWAEVKKDRKKEKKSSQNRMKAGLTVKFSFSTCTYQHLFHCSAGNSVSEINVCNLTCTCCSLHSKRTLQVHSIPHKTQCLTCQEQSQLQTARHFLHKDNTKSLESKTVTTIKKRA